MGFFSELGKAFMGKPLGPQSDGAQNQSVPANSGLAGNGVLDERGRKIIPDIDVKNLKSYRQGDSLIVKAWVVNNSQQLLRVDSSRLLQQKRQHNQELQPGQSREIALYQGPAPRNENERSAQIAYRLKANGDVFEENYRIEYNLEADGTRTVEELHDDGPVRDI